MNLEVKEDRDWSDIIVMVLDKFLIQPVPRKMKIKKLPFCTLFYILISFSIFSEFSAACDTINETQSLKDGQTLVSSGQSFELGFFSPGESKGRYLGIWYKNSPSTIVWVANKEKPITDSYGVLSFGGDGNLVVLNQAKGIIWSSSLPRIIENPVVQLLESGNLVLGEKSVADPERYIWQSFDFPCHTQLPGMKFGWSSKTKQDLYLTSWRSASDPSPGDFTWRMDTVGRPQAVLRKGSEKKFRAGPWLGSRFSGYSVAKNMFIKPYLPTNEEEFYYFYELVDKSIVTRLTLDEHGSVARFVLRERGPEWDFVFALQGDKCDDYGRCGANSICRILNKPICQCLDGFVPRSQNEWQLLIWASGCVRRTPLNCQKGEGFIEVQNVKLPDPLEFWVNASMTLKECEAACLKNCSCMAYSNSDIRKGGSGCLIWYGDLIDVREFIGEAAISIYIRMSASELELLSDSNGKKKHLLTRVVASSASGVLFLGLLIWCLYWKLRRKTGLDTKKEEDLELPLFDLSTVASATNNFSKENMIGKGGFGPVYKGILSTGQEIAVKRLLNNSGQGLQEFKNEVILIAKLQHLNLVRLLGCCIAEEERMLIYEYLPNKSLDYIIFDPQRSSTLAWQKRFDVTTGVARGLLYLHQDSRLRVIHRDLKTSNILLDNDLNPKISDFGIARIFERDQTEEKTERVIGTFGYMSPEYAFYGKFSVKSDVFSMGVLLLEIVSGRKNRGFRHPDHPQNLLGHAWLLWTKDKALELMDGCLKDSCVESQVLRCIQVGLLCVQKHSADRPTMSSVVFMLGNEEAVLPQPKQPGFFVDSGPDGNGGRCQTENEVTVTRLEAR